MDDRLRKFASEQYTNSSGDLCTMFVERSLGLVIDSGVASLVVSESWLFNATFEEMRASIVRRARPLCTACIDKLAFGVRVNTAASVFQRGGMGTKSQFFRVSREVISSGDVKRLPPAGETVYVVEIDSFSQVPSGAFIFDMPAPLLALYRNAPTVGDAVDVKQGLATADNGRFVRYWWEVSRSHIAFAQETSNSAASSGKRWFPYNKGGTPIAWWGNQDHIVNWENDGREIRAFGTEDGGRPRSAVRNPSFYFKPAVTWSNIGSGGARFRLIPPGFVFDVAGMSAFTESETARLNLLGYLNSTMLRRALDVLAPTLNYQVGDVARLPYLEGGDDHERVAELVRLTRAAWADSETAHEFQTQSLIHRCQTSVKAGVSAQISEKERHREQVASLEQASDEYWTTRIAEVSGVAHEVEMFSAPPVRSHESESRSIADLVSYFVGCMFGRYSLDEHGLILADQGATIQDYIAKIPAPRFMPDTNNVIPIVDGDWFEDDIVSRFREFLRVAFGVQHFEENLRFVTESLGVKDLRDYFVKSFYNDHVKRYKKRPIYWLFSSPKGSFNALIYMHRYTSSTVSTVLNDYLREFKAKLESSLEHQERLAAGGGTARQQAAAQKEADKLRKVLLELDEYEHDVLYPLASQQIEIDLDDGVKANYPKFGTALKKIPGLEAVE